MQQQSVFIQLPSAPIQTIYTTIQQVIQSKIPFFITSETGVGKEGIAKYIHESSPRRDKPFIAINCGDSPLNFCKVNFLDMKREHSQARSDSGAGPLKWQMEASSFSMKSQECFWTPRVQNTWCSYFLQMHEY